MTKCDFCSYRNSYECEEYHPQNGCEDFSLDQNTLTEEEQRRFIIEGIIQDYKSR